MNQDQGEQSSMEVAKPDNVGAVSAGEQLKQARLALGLSVDDVSTRLKLSANKIESLERGDITDIAAPVFVAGYLRAYARLLELQEDAVVADFGMLSAMQSSVDDAESGSTLLETMGSKSDEVIYTGASTTGNIFSNSKSLLMPVVMSVLVIAAVYFALLNEESADDVRVATVVSGEPEDAPAVSGDEAADDEVTASVVESPTVSDVPVVTEVPVSTAANEIGKNEVANDEKGTEAFHQSELALVFNDESWVEVTDARGDRLVYRLAKAGMSRTVTGAAPFTVQLGYVPGVEIFYNGVPYDMSRFSGRRSARFRVGKIDDRMAGG